MKKTFAAVLVTAMTTVLAWSGAATAQDIGLRDDAQRDLFTPQVESQVVRALTEGAAAAPPSLKLRLAFGAIYNNNAGFTPSNETEGTAISPSATLTYRHEGLFERLDFVAEGDLQGTYYSGAESNFDDGKIGLNLALATTNPTTRRTWAVSYRGAAIYNGSFSERRRNLLEYAVSVTQNFTNTPGQTVLAARVGRGDGPRAARRTFAQVDFTHQFEQFHLFNANWRFAERLLYSDYEESSSPDGLMARTTFGPSWTLEDGRTQVGVALTHVHNFSDADDADAVVFGPTISRTF